MPVMNGIDMIKEIYKIIPDQPILVTSAHSDAHYLIDLLNLGVNGFLIKPIKRNVYYTIPESELEGRP